MNEITIYESSDGQLQLDVQIDNETVWLTQAQMVDLFESSKTNISEHLTNIFNDEELDKEASVRKFRIVRKEGNRFVTRNIDHYNLDVIISVGYRVNTKRGIQFRQWATQKLKAYVVQGYAINQKRLNELNKVIQLIEQSGATENLELREAKGLLDILGSYTRSFVLLNQFDSQNLSSSGFNPDITYKIDYLEATSAIAELKAQLILKKEATELFGKEKDNSFEGILGNIVQTFGGQYLYSSIEEQAAHLLYFIIKNHPFNDGNKRIGAFLFIWFLDKNKHRFKTTGELKINDRALTALALLVAQSNPADKELMTKLICNLINE